MAKARKITGVMPQDSYRENARIVLPQQVEEVYTWEPFIWDVARREELHNMRISIKRLRYTMELFRFAYGAPKMHSKETAVADNERFTEFLKVIVDLQEILGDIHDGDVVLEVLADYETRSEQRTTTSGIAKLITQTRETRNTDYKTFLEKWEQLSVANFKQQLLSFFGS
ncbi:CHAD domain-containing protein [Candidatus Poribacteria bacterium]|nr:CHAD domain-containing protein [Candidatus Poribacteria bacterium]